MTEPSPTGAAPAPVDEKPAPAQASPFENAPPAHPPGFGAFGTTRGSGLGRGKRSSAAPAPSAAGFKADYKPTAVEVIVSQREYQNPFAPPTLPPEAAEGAASDPARGGSPPLLSGAAEGSRTPTGTVAPAPDAAPAFGPESASPFRPGAAETPAALERTAAPIFHPAPAALGGDRPKPSLAEKSAPAADAPSDEAPVAEKGEIRILPPADSKRTAMSWETGSSSSSPRLGDESDVSSRPRRDDRPVFRPEPRRDSPAPPSGASERAASPSRERSFREQGGRNPGAREQGFRPRREQGSEGAPFRGAAPVPARPPAESAPASGGFIGWLKGLFRGGKSEVPAAPAPTAPENRDGEFSPGGNRHRRRRRGGRGRHQGGGEGGDQGFSGGNSPQGRTFDPEPTDSRSSEGGGSADESGFPPREYRPSEEGPRHHRRRGGRGRHRGGDSRSEGRQGGGAL